MQKKSLATFFLAELLERVVSVMAPYENISPIRIWMGPTLYVVVTDPRDIEVRKSNKMLFRFLDARESMIC